MTSGGNSFNDFTQNKLTKYRFVSTLKSKNCATPRGRGDIAQCPPPYPNKYTTDHCVSAVSVNTRPGLQYVDVAVAWLFKRILITVVPCTDASN